MSTPTTELVESPPASCEKRTTRLRQSELAMVLQLHKDGFTQAQIAQRLGVTQQAISKWLSAITDTTDVAKLFLRGNALSMAQNIVKKGRAADHVKTLEGLEVLSNQDVKGGLTIVVGGSAQVQVNIGTRQHADTPQAVVVEHGVIST